MSVDWDKPIQDEEGRSARLIGAARTTCGKNCRVVVIDYGDGDCVRCYWESGFGVYVGPRIVNAPIRRTVYLNVYDAGTDCVPICSVHASKELADSITGGCLVKVACVELTYTEGEGLSNGS